MTTRSINNVKLGALVLGGLLFLILLLYMIGNNEHLFGSTYTLKAKFTNVQGLVEGNNVRFSGIEVGTVKKTRILDDGLIEVTMVIDKNMLSIIRNNAVVSIGTDGLVGNKVVNIVPAGRQGSLVKEGEMLRSKEAVGTEEMLETLYHTNNDVAIIATELKTTIKRVNSSALWSLMDDSSIHVGLKTAVADIASTARTAGDLADNLDGLVADVKNGKGSIGMILTDSSFAEDLGYSLRKLKSTTSTTDSIAGELNKIAAEVHKSITNGKGVTHLLLNDSIMTKKIETSLDNIQKGTNGFNENMEALKHNFFFRGYFRKQEKKRKQSSQ
ncbi:MAG: MlaD family protein [Taibaiella sp.]|jgi:phospholipid/cholesterol/gamma-HCH transport system substrate-binding protein